MKKITVYLVLSLVFISNAFTQNDSTFLNKFMLGGNLGLNLHKTNDYYEYEEKTIDFNFKTVAGVFITNKVALGLSVEFDFLEHPELEWEKNLSFRVFARYQGNIDDKFKFYIDPYIGATFYLEDDKEEKRREFNIGADFGLLYFVSKKFSLELKLMEVSYYKQTKKDSDEVFREFDISYDIVKPNFGIRFYL